MDDDLDTCQIFDGLEKGDHEPSYQLVMTITLMMTMSVTMFLRLVDLFSNWEL